MNIEKYEYYGVNVSVFSELKGKHKEMCLCWKCALLIIDPAYPAQNCEIARENYELCKKHHVVTPVFECPKFISKEKI